MWSKVMDDRDTQREHLLYNLYYYMKDTKKAEIRDCHHGYTFRPSFLPRHSLPPSFFPLLVHCLATLLSYLRLHSFLSCLVSSRSRLISSHIPPPLPSSDTYLLHRFHCYASTLLLGNYAVLNILVQSSSLLSSTKASLALSPSASAPHPSSISMPLRSSLRA